LGGGWAISIIAPRRRLRDAARRSSAGTSSAAFSAAFLISSAASLTASFGVDSSRRVELAAPVELTGVVRAGALAPAASAPAVVPTGEDMTVLMTR